MDLVAFIIKQKYSRIFDFFGLIPLALKYVFKAIDIKTFMETFYNVVLKSITISELNLFKVQNMHKIDLSGFGIEEDSSNDYIITAEPSFLIDLFINRRRYNVICTDYDLRTRKIADDVCLNSDKVDKLKANGIDTIHQLFIYSFKEKQLMDMAEFIFVYRDHSVIEFDSYEGTLKDKIFNNITNSKLITYAAIALLSSLAMIVFSGILTMFMSVFNAFVIGYIFWIGITFTFLGLLCENNKIAIRKFPFYLLAILPHFLLQVLLVLVFGQIIGLYGWVVVLVNYLIALPLLIFIVRFYKFD